MSQGTGEQFTLTCSATDPSSGSGQAQSGLDVYEVEYRIDDGEWQSLYTGADTSQVFAGEPGHVYTFRVRATDRVSNVSAWVQAEARTVVVKKYYSVAGQRIAMRENGVLYYLHSDHLGSTSLTTDESGNVAAAQKYLPYGEVRWVTGTLPTDLTYTGQRQEDFGLMDYRARMYSSRLGRFISADTLVPGAASSSGGGAATLGYNRNTRLTPLTVGFHEPQFLSVLNAENAELVQFGPPALWSGKVRQEHTVPMGPINPQALNRYAYCLNNALRYVDPSGHTAEIFWKLKLSPDELQYYVDLIEKKKNDFSAIAVPKKIWG